MPIQKIQSGRVITVIADNFVGNAGQLFYDESTGDIRLSDGITVGGKRILGQGSIVQSATAPAASTSTIWYDTVSERLFINNTVDWIPVSGNASTVLSTASTTVLGGIKVGNELSISNTGTLNVVLSAVGQDVIPSIDAEYSLGSAQLRWKELYVSTGSVYIGDLRLSNDNGTLLVGDTTELDLDPHSVFRGERDVDDYINISLRNLNTGSSASS